MVENETGKRYKNDTPPKRLEDRKHTYQLTFSKVEEIENIYVGTEKLRAIDYLDDLTIKMEFARKTNVKDLK